MLIVNWRMVWLFFVVCRRSEMIPWGASSSAKDESGVCLCVLVRIVHWVVLRVRCRVNVVSWFENVVAARIL